MSCKNRSTVHNNSKFKQNIISKDKMLEQYFTALSFLYPNQESYDFTWDQSMRSFHVKNMELYTS